MATRRNPPASMADCFPPNRSPEARIPSSLPRNKGTASPIVAARGAAANVNATFRLRPPDASRARELSRAREGLETEQRAVAEMVGRTPTGQPQVLIARDAGSPGILGDIVGRIKFGVGELGENLAALLIALGDAARPFVLSADYSTGTTVGVASLAMRGAPGMTLVAYALTEEAVGIAGRYTLDVSAAGRTITHGPVFNDGVAQTAGVGPRCFPRPIFVPETAQCIVTAANAVDNITSGGVRLIGFAVKSEVAEVVRQLLGSLSVYQLFATPTYKNPTVAIKAGPFEPQRAFQSLVTGGDAGTNVKLYLGKANPQSFPYAISGTDIPTVENPLILGGQVMQVSDQLRLECDITANGQVIIVQGGEFV